MCDKNGRYFRRILSVNRIFSKMNSNEYRLFFIFSSIIYNKLIRYLVDKVPKNSIR